MDTIYIELLEELGLRFDAETTTFTIPEPVSTEQALEQYRIFSEIPWTVEEMETILSFVYAVDQLNRKYLQTYDVTVADYDIVAGLEVSYERAIGSIVYGFLHELYTLFNLKPKVYQAIFGPRLGRVLFDHSLQMKPFYERLQRLREQWEESPDAFADLLQDELNDINLKQKQLATSLGLSEEVSDSVARGLFDDHFHGTFIDLEAIENELSMSSNETLKRRIESGKEEFPSDEYRFGNKLTHIQDEAKRKKILEAVKTAKDKDRASAGRKKDQSGTLENDGFGVARKSENE